MTLMEVLVALVVFGLIATFTFSNLGFWMRQSRTAEREAAFWRDVGPAELSIAELAAAMDDPAQTLRVTASNARFRAYDPRLAATPQSIVLRIETSAAGSRLLLDDAGDGGALLLNTQHPLRFAPEARSALVLEAMIDRHWTPIIVAPWASTAPLACDFDPVSRTCR